MVSLAIALGALRHRGRGGDISIAGVAIAVGVLAIVIVIGVFLQKMRRRAWEEAARQLGFRSGTGERGGPEMSGTVEGCDVAVSIERRGSGKSSHSYTVFRVKYPRPLGLDFRVAKTGVLSGIAKFFGAQDIETGDAEFDARFTIKGQDPEEVVRFLTPERRAVIAEFLGSYSTTLGGDEVHWETLGAITDAETIREKVCDLVRCARDIAGVSTREPAPPHGERPELAAEERESPREEPELAAEEPEAPPEKPESLPDESRAPPEGPEPPPEELVAPAEEPEPGPSAGVEEVCQTLFGETVSTFETRRAFEERYQGKDIVWEGMLRSVDGYSYDLALGSAPGVKGTFEVFKVSTALSDEKEVLAAVRFPPGDCERLEARIGSTVRFSGRLCEVDDLMRTIYVTDGALFD